MVVAPVYFKDNLLERIGGASNFDFLIISYSERIQDDESLHRFYGHIQLYNLNAFQKELVSAALIQPTSKSSADALKTRVALRHYRLFDLGFNETHFDALSRHFSHALLDCWQDDDVIVLCEKYFQEMRPIFVRNSCSAKRSAIAEQNTNDRLSLSLRETMAGNALDAAGRLCKSEQYVRSVRPAFRPANQQEELA